MNIAKHKLEHWQSIFEEIEEYFSNNLNEELDGIVTDIEEYRKTEGLTYRIEERNESAREYMDMRNKAKRGMNDIEREILKHVEESY